MLRITKFGKGTRRNPACLSPGAVQADSSSWWGTKGRRHPMCMNKSVLHPRLLSSFTELNRAGESITSGLSTTWTSHRTICTSTGSSRWGNEKPDNKKHRASYIHTNYCCWTEWAAPDWSKLCPILTCLFWLWRSSKDHVQASHLETLNLPETFPTLPPQQERKCSGFEPFTFQRAVESEGSPCICWSAPTHSPHLGEDWQLPHIVSSWS